MEQIFRPLLFSFLTLMSFSVAADDQGLESIPTLSPAQLEAVVNKRSNDLSQAPAWVRSASVKDVSTFFVDKGGKPLAQPDHRGLLNYATQLFNYQESQNKTNLGLFRGFVQNHLRPFVRSLSYTKLKQRFSSRYTVEDLVVTQQLSYLSRSKNFIKNSMGLITGPHLRSVSVSGLKLVAFGTAVYAANHYLGFSDFMLGMIIGGLNNAVGGPLVGVITGWFTNPTSQFLRLKTIPLTAPLERKMNALYDRASSDSSADNSSAPRLGVLEKDGTDFAGMTPEDQKENLRRVTGWWASLQIRFGQVFRDTLHGGRNLFVGHANDELNYAGVMEIVETKLVALRNLEEQLLNPYKIDKMRLGDRHQLERLTDTFDRYRRKADQFMTTVEMDEAKEDLLLREFDQITRELRALGMTDRDLLELKSIQVDKARALGVIATTIAANEARHFNFAEYRTLEGPAYEFFKNLQQGLQLQRRVVQHQKAVAAQQITLGYQNSTITQPRLVGPAMCALVLSNRSLPN